MMMESVDILDDGIEVSHRVFATKSDLFAMEEELKKYIADQMAHLRRWTLGIAVGAAVISVAIIGILVTVT